MKLVHIGSYFEGENDIVAQMYRSLSALKIHHVTALDPQIYSWKRAMSTRGGSHSIRYLRNRTLKKALSFSPEAIILNAGRLSLTQKQKSRLARQGVTVVGIGLSDPDLVNSGIEIARRCDLYYTNARVALEKYQSAGIENVKVSLFGIEADKNSRLHSDSETLSDLVLVGGRRPERVELVKYLCQNGLNVACYGKGWALMSEENLTTHSEVHGLEYIRALSSGKAYLSFSQTAAGYFNLKIGALDAMALGIPVVTEDFPEMREIFKANEEVTLYSTKEEALVRIRSLVEDPVNLVKLGNRGQDRVFADHTWTSRWSQILQDIQDFKKGRNR